MRFAVGAAGLAIEDSGLEWDRLDPQQRRRGHGYRHGPGRSARIDARAGRCLPTRTASCETRRLGQRGAGSLFPLWILKYLPNMVAAHISLAFNAQGPNSTITTACAAGTQAVGEGFRLIARGDAESCSPAAPIAASTRC